MGRYALLIGVSNYIADLNPLPSAVRDVAALQQVLVNPEIGGFAESDVVALPNPEKGAIETAIYHLFANRKPDDLLLFYFSGHGVMDNRSDFYFTGISTRKEALPPTAISSVYVQREMDKSRSQYQVVILDCCHSGVFPKGMKAKDIGTVDLAPKLGGEGRAILTAADSAQYAFEQEGFELSLYTHFLVEGLKTGAADRDDDGHVSVDELHVYVEGKVKNVNNSMSPQFFGQKEGHRIVLARAAQDDPKLKFRKEVEKFVIRGNGKASPVAESLLKRRYKELEIDPLVAEVIISEILRPYVEYDKKLEEYEDTLLKAISRGFPFGEALQADLEDYENYLGLRDEDRISIKNRIIAPRQADYERRLQEERQSQEQKARINQKEAENRKQQQAVEIERLKRQQKEAERTRKNTENPELLKRTVRLISRRNFLVFTGLTGGGFLSILGWKNLQPKPISKTFEFTTVTVDKTGKVIKSEPKQSESLIYSLGNGITLDFVQIPAGKFMMGTPPAERQVVVDNWVKYGLKREDVEKYIDWSTPQHEVTVPAFLMGKYTVTNGQWLAVMGSEPKEAKTIDVKFKGQNQPVVGVSWNDCQDFYKTLSQQIDRKVRLPSEAEWEYACRAGTTTPFHFGETITPALVNYDGNYSYGDAPKGEYRATTVDVATFSPNAWGLHQMHGNVWEWCEDTWHDNYKNAPSDGASWVSGGESARVLRGGSWDCIGFYCRSAGRIRNYTDRRNCIIGFRVVV